MQRLFRITVERCTACGKCELACAFSHATPAGPGKSRVSVFRQGQEAGIPITCLQCDQAACVAACPSAALVRNQSTGAIELTQERCLRCQACVAACPFGCMQWDASQREAQKCDLCGGDPTCARYCPTAALEYV